MRYKIRIVYDFEELEYVVYTDGFSNLEGRGKTEKEAVDNFYLNYEKFR